jgi:hypothetical protein
VPSEEILVLASSRKLGGRCIAGITRSGEWIRPVCGRPRGLWKAECEVHGRWPEVLDVVRFGYRKRLGDSTQPENVLVDDSAWELKDRVPPEETYERLRPFLATGPGLLGNRGKAMTEEEAATGVDASLALVEASSGVSFLMRPAEETYGKLKPRAVFDFSATRYELGLTDIALEEAVRRAGVGEHDPEALGFERSGPTLLTISLGEAHEGWHTKLAAAAFLVTA